MSESNGEEMTNQKPEQQPTPQPETREVDPVEFYVSTLENEILSLQKTSAVLLRVVRKLEAENSARQETINRQTAKILQLSHEVDTLRMRRTISPTPQPAQQPGRDHESQQ